MWAARAFVIAHLFFFTLPVAMILVASRPGGQFALFGVMAPYMVIVLALQMFRCPGCRQRVYSLENLQGDGRWFKPSTRFSCCHSCGTSFWSGRKSENDSRKP